MEADGDQFIDYIDGRVDILDAKLQQDVKQFKSLLVFFHSLKKELAQFTKSFLKSVLNLKDSLLPAASLSDNIQSMLDQYIDLANALDGYRTEIETKVIVSLDSFVARYERINGKIVSKAERIVAKVAEQKLRLKKMKSRYYKDSKAAMNCNSPESYKSKTSIADEKKKEYLRFVDVLNTDLDDYKQKYGKLLRTWCGNEERKLSHTKDIFLKFHEATASIASTCLNFTDRSKALAESINPCLDMSSYISQANTGKEKLFDRAVFELAPTDTSSNEKEVRELISTGITEEDLAFAQKSVKALADDESVDKAEFERLLSITQTKEGEKAVCKVLNHVCNKTEIENREVFDCLLTFAETLMNQITSAKFLEVKHLSSILNLGAYFSYYDAKTASESSIERIRSRITDRAVWKGKDVWARILSCRVAKSLKKLRAYDLFMAEQKDSGKEGKKPDPPKRDEQEDTRKRNTAFNELLFIGSEMVFYSVSPEVARETILNAAKEWGVESDRVYRILSSYEIAQPIPRDEDPSPRELIRYSLGKREKERKRYNHSTATMIIGLSLEYVNNISTLACIRLLSRKCYTLFKEKIYCIALSMSSEKTRFKLWKSVLYSKGFTTLYEKLKETKMKAFVQSNTEADRVICLDVMRSFGSASEEEKEAIKSILRCYAVTNPEVEYCQGMNSIAGMLYMIYKDEATVFTMLSTLIAEFGLSNLFKDDVPMLKTCFYTLNRLLAVFLPSLHQHFLEEAVTMDYFATSWFMTVFTCVVELAKSPNVPPLLVQIFDGFLTQGIKSLFKTSLFILGYHEAELLRLNSEGAIKLLSKLPATDFFSCPEVLKAYLQQIENYNVTQRLLDKLNGEHDKICSLSKEYKMGVQLPKLPFKHYIKHNGKPIPVYLAY